MRRTAALIVGGGPAGAAAAIALARGGMPPLLLERTREAADALCGGFLSWRTLDTLTRLGIPAERLGGHVVTRARLFAGGRIAQAPLPAAAMGVSRRQLDLLLLGAAVRTGAGVERGVTVRSIAGTTAHTADGGSIGGDALLLASGKHEVRGSARPAAARGRDPAIGLRLRLGASARLLRLVGGTIELHLFDRGYAGLVLQEDGTANLCMAVRRSRLAAAGGTAALLAELERELPLLGERLAAATSRSAIDAVANVPYGWRARTTGHGLFRLGDQAGVIPSLAGEGIGIALASGALAAAGLLRAGPAGAAAFQAGFAARLAQPLALAGLVRMAAERPVGARLLVAAAGLHPPLLGHVAGWTRIAQSTIDDRTGRQHI